MGWDFIFGWFSFERLWDEWDEWDRWDRWDGWDGWDRWDICECERCLATP